MTDYRQRDAVKLLVSACDFEVMCEHPMEGDARTEWQSQSIGLMVRTTVHGTSRRIDWDYFIGDLEMHSASLTWPGTPDPETMADQLLLSTCAEHQTFGEFCAEWCYRVESPTAQRLYGSCLDTARNLRRALGELADPIMGQRGAP